MPAASAAEPSGPTCHSVLDADPAAFLFQVRGASSILGAVMGGLVPVEGVLDLGDFPRATVHDGIGAITDQSLANTCDKGKVAP